ncbi:hypothetical protein AX16_009766 [Volvariella volvacea WC 439]|nr:hypothetical protein AX16_009766 [Volvariella volvacea WC 439]
MSDDTKTLKFLGPDAAQQVIDFIQTIRNVPLYFDWLTVFQLGCLSAQLKYHQSAPPSPTSLTSSEITLLSHRSESTAADDDYISPFERVYFYHGISDDPPPLFQRSDVKQRPFPIPEERPKERHSAIPVKTAHTANHPILKNTLWKGSVAPDIIALLKEESHGIHVSTMLPVRFSTPDEEGKDVFDDHIVLWISVHPNTTKETSCHDANAPILAIFAKYDIHDVAVHWIEGIMESLAGPPEMMPVARDTNPTHWIRRALTAVLGVPLAAQEMADDDSQGSLGIYFHCGKDRNGKKSREVMAITNKHVVSKKTKEDYEYSERQGAPKKYIRNCGLRRFEQVLNETRALLAEKLADAKQFAEQLAELVAERPAEEDPGYEADLEKKESALKNAKLDVGILDDFLKLLKSTWSDAVDHIVGWVDWAPKIANNVDPHRYTRDIGIITLDEDKFINNFKGNFVYLAGKFTRDEIIACFYPNAANPPGFKYPNNHLSRLLGCVDAAGFSTPYFRDENGNPCFIVAKDGQSTDLTFGRQSELEAYTCSDLTGESWEVAVLNFGGRKHGNFSGKGDSGAAIFNAEGKLVAILHSGMPREMSNHVTFGIPGHYVEQLVKEKYPHADFSRMNRPEHYLKMELERHQKQNSSLFRSVIRLQDDDEVRQHIWVLSKMVELCQRFPVGLLLFSCPEHYLKVKIAEYHQKSPSLFCPFIELGIDTNVQKQMRGLLYPMYCNLSGIEVDPDWKPTMMLDDIFETVISDACGQFMIIEAITTYMVRNDVIPGLDVVKKLHDDGEVQSVAFSKLDKRYDVVMTSAESCLTAVTGQP